MSEYQRLASAAAQQLAQESNGNISYRFYASGNDLVIVLYANVGGKIVEFGKHIEITSDERMICDDHTLIHDLAERVEQLRKSHVTLRKICGETPLVNERKSG